MAEELRAKGEQIVIPVSGFGRVEGGVYAEDGMSIDDTGGKADLVIDLNTLAMLPGAHNWQNAAAAYAAAKTAGVEPSMVRVSVGYEEYSDIQGDFEQALAQC